MEASVNRRKFERESQNKKMNLLYLSPNGMVSNIFFSMSSESLAVISDAINPGATALT